MAKAGVTDDITINTIGGTPIGFMLVRGKNGRRGFAIQDSSVLEPRVLSESELTQASFAPGLVHVDAVEDFALGMGGQIERLHPRRIKNGRKVVTTSFGKVELAPQMKEPAEGTSPATYKPSGFGTSGKAQVLAMVGGSIFLYTYGTTGSWADASTASISPGFTQSRHNGHRLNDRTYFPTWWDVTPNAAGQNGVNDFATRLPAEYVHAGLSSSTFTEPAFTTPGFKYMVVSKNAANTDILVGAWRTLWVHSGVTFQNMLFNDSSKQVVGGDVSAFVVGQYIRLEEEVLRITAVNAGTTTLTFTRGEWGTTGAAHAQGTGGVIYIFESVNNVIRTTTDPTGNNWSGDTLVGGTDSPITGVAYDGDTLLVGKTNGIWGVFANGSVTLLTAGWDAHPNNCKGMHYWNGRLIIPRGDGELWERFDDGEEVNSSLYKYFPDQPEFHGRVTAVTSAGDRVFVMVHDSSHLTYHVLMGRWFEGDYRWNHIGNISYVTGTTEDLSTLFYEGVPSGSNAHNRLWAGIHSTGSNSLPKFWAFDDDQEEGFTSDSVATTHASGTTVASGLASDATVTTFVSSDGTVFRDNDIIKIESEVLTVSGTSGTSVTVQRGMHNTTAATHADATAISHVDAPYIHWTPWDKGLPKVEATWSKAEYGSENLATGDPDMITQYRQDNGVWVEDSEDSGAAAGAGDGLVDTSPNQTMKFPQGTTARKMEIRGFPVLAAVSTTGPAITSVKVSSQIRTEALRVLPLTLHLADRQIRLNGARRGRPNLDRAQLKTWDEQAAEVTVVDATGESKDYVFLPGHFRQVQTAFEMNRRPEWAITVMLAEA